MPRGGAREPSPAGNWLVEATVPGGGSYTGAVAARPVGDALEFSWDISVGRYCGWGLEQGGAWYVACGEDEEGLGLALVGRDGRLRWTPAPGRGMVGRAALSGVAAPPGAVGWEAGPGAAAGLPFARLAILGGGEVLEAELRGGSTERGLALPTNSGWAVAWYPRFDQTVILRYLPGREPGTWVGLWALGGHPEPAVELLHPVG